MGEAGAWGYLEGSESIIRKFARYLVGQDPLRIEHHWQYMYRSSHFRGAAIMSAHSAIDIALWDIAGKHFGVPAYQLLGGKCRDKARVYYHVLGHTKEELLRGIRHAKEMGFTAVGHLTPFLDEPQNVPFFKTDSDKMPDVIDSVRASWDVPYFRTHVDRMRDGIDTVRAYREAAGDNVDLCIEIHR